MPEMPSKKADKVTVGELRRVVKWFRRKMAMQDWTVSLELSALVPAWCTGLPWDVANTLGRSWSAASEKDSLVWINRPNNDTVKLAINTTIHELLHMQFADIDLYDRMGEPDGEFVISRLADQLTEAYLLSF